MSKHKNKCCCCNCYSNYPSRYCGCGGNYGGKKSSNGLLILILILLQFRCHGAHHCRENEHDCYRSSACEVDNSVLFIIALYYLSCCNNFSLCCSGC